MKIRSFFGCVMVVGVLAAASFSAEAQRAGAGGYGAMGRGGPPGGVQPMPGSTGRTDVLPRGQPGDRIGERPAGPQTGLRDPGRERMGEAGIGRSPGELLQQNSRLSDRLGKLLPEGTDVQAEATGFRNLGQFVAAVHVSKNLGIPFADVKSRMVGGESLGEAIRALRPDTDWMIEERRAEAQARDTQGS